ncbi:unnamed protein product, partial [Hymenolepis diminuta]
FKPKTIQTEINLYSRDLPPTRNPETPETQRNHRSERYPGRFGRPRKRLKVDQTSDV